MTLDPERRFLGRKMQVHCEWARNSVPELAIRGTAEIAKVVRVAREEVEGFAIAVVCLTAFASMIVTWRLTRGAVPGNGEAWTAAVAAVLAGAVCTAAAQFICTLIFQRKIVSVARYTYSTLPHA